MHAHASASPELCGCGNAARREEMSNYLFRPELMAGTDAVTLLVQKRHQATEPDQCIVVLDRASP